MRFEGTLYRALNPLWARNPLSGRGAALYGGRFNAKGREALYTSLRPETAIREANQAGTLQPTVLVAILADTEPVFDARDPELLAAEGLTPGDLARDDWRDLMARGKAVRGQDLAERLIARGVKGALVPSYAKGAQAGETNLVLWQWDGLRLVDDENRLGR